MTTAGARNQYNCEVWLEKTLKQIPDGPVFLMWVQEVRRIPSMAKRYTKWHPSFLEFLAMRLCLFILEHFSKKDQGSSEILHFGYHIHAVKKR